MQGGQLPHRPHRRWRGAEDAHRDATDLDLGHRERPARTDHLLPDSAVVLDHEDDDGRVGESEAKRDGNRMIVVGPNRNVSADERMAVNFDIDRYVASVAALDDSDIDYDDFRRQPLPDDALRCLRYMHDVEHHTVCYLRDLLVTRAHDDPVITTFLTMWAYEEFWHGEAIGKVLRAHGEIAGRPRIDAARERVGSGRLGTLGTMFASVLTEHIVTVSLTWGAVNEWTTQAAYVRLAQRTGHPTLTELVRRIAKQEGRHIDFYASEATRRLENRRAQRMTRWALAHLWTPVGSGVMPHEETVHLITHLFGDDEGAEMARRIDRRIDRLPGLSGLALIDGARREYAAIGTAEHARRDDATTRSDAMPGSGALQSAA